MVVIARPPSLPAVTWHISRCTMGIVVSETLSGMPAPSFTIKKPAHKLKGSWTMESNLPLNPQTLNGYSATQNRVLRNTYALLALSLVPTVFGAWLGVQFNFSLFAGRPLIGFVLFLAIALGFFYGIEKTKNSGWGLAHLLGFTFFMVLMLSRRLGKVLGFSNGSMLIATAFGGSFLVFFGMGTLAGTIKGDLSNMR